MTTNGSRPSLGTLFAAQPVILPNPGLAVRAKRLARTVGVAVEHFGPAVAGKLLRRKTHGSPIARAGRRMCEDLGATYVKFAQLVASAPGVVGAGVAEEFRGTLDKGPGVRFRDVRAIIEEDTGKTLEEAFASFERRPFAAASVAVVHRATLHNGEQVAVKVLRPGLGEVVAADIGIMDPFFQALAKLGSEPAFQLVSYLVGLKAQIGEELDLRNEAQSMSHFRGLFETFGLDLLVVPRVHATLSGPRVLTMEYLDGAPIDDLAMVEEMGLDPKALIRELLRAWVLTAVHAGIFHADIHAGNLLAMPDGRLGMLDWGIVARLDPDSHLLMRKLVEASLGDEEAWDTITAAIIRINGVTLKEGIGLTDEEIGKVVRSMMEPILTKPLKDVSMSSIFAGPDEAMRIARGYALGKKTLRQRIKTIQNTARANRLALKQGYHEEAFQRSNFLSSKQLIYLERYGRMYVPEHAILGDTEFLRTALAQEWGP